MKKYFKDTFKKILPAGRQAKQKFGELREKTIVRVWNLAKRMDKQGNKKKEK